LFRAHDWYKERSPAAADAFIRRMRRCVELIAESPERWPLYAAGTRRFVSRDFPYSVFYETTETAIRVLAFAHDKRRPRYWRRRR
jgi:plasmid stabilization system protein ParE